MLSSEPYDACLELIKSTAALPKTHEVVVFFYPPSIVRFRRAKCLVYGEIMDDDGKRPKWLSSNSPLLGTCAVLIIDSLVGFKKHFKSPPS